VDLTGFLDAYDARDGAQLAKRPIAFGGGGPLSLSWGGVSVARNTIYAAVGIRGLDEGLVVAFRPGNLSDARDDAQQTLGELQGGEGPDAPAGPGVLAGPDARDLGYATPVVTAQAGGKLSFTNADIAQHDVTAVQNGPDGRPVFQSRLIGFGQTAPIEGLDRIQAGKSYEFYCSIHPGMRGTLIAR
jgi:plastocyanin